MTGAVLAGVIKVVLESQFKTGQFEEQGILAKKQPFTSYSKGFPLTFAVTTGLEVFFYVGAGTLSRLYPLLEACCSNECQITH